MAESIEVLVSTMNESEPLALVERMGLRDADVDVLVINQCTRVSPPAPLAQGRVRMLSFAERGLSRSRNHALEHARGEILLIADDDIRYRRGFVEEVRFAYERQPAADGITFRFVKGAAGEPGRRYPDAACWHHPLSVASVTSFEISLRRAVIGGARFDTRFGLGADLPQGEEAIFLLDLLRAGRRLRFEPIVTCDHPGDTSGHKPWDDAMIRTKGAVLRRAYPYLWPALCGWFVLNKRAQHSPSMSVPRFAGAILLGALQLPAATEKTRS